MITDHLGNNFKTQKEMCEYWHIETNTYKARIRSKWPIEDALTVPKNGKRRNISEKETHVTDHFGHKFKSIGAMCDHWNVSQRTFCKRRDKNWSLEECLTGKDSKDSNIIIDHKGQKFKNQKEMCNHWGINLNTYKARIAKKWSIEKALTYPLNYSENKKIKDHAGQEFNDQKTMLEYWNISYSVFYKRKKNGWTLKEILTTPTKENTITDPFGNIYANITDMCDTYNTSKAKYVGRIRMGYTQAEALNIIPLISKKNKNKKINDRLTILNPIKELNKSTPFYFFCLINNEETVMTRNEIVTYLLLEIKKGEQDANTGNKKSK